jgi:hypothetical protein
MNLSTCPYSFSQAFVSIQQSAKKMSAVAM